MRKKIKLVFDKILWRIFNFFEHFGFHVLPIHFYSPVPDTRVLKKKSDQLLNEQPMVGVNFRDDSQLDIVANLLKNYEDEYCYAGKGLFGIDQNQMPSFAPINGLTLYSFIRHFKPKRVIEIGAGMSTKISASAILRNKDEGSIGNYVVIDPYPSEELRAGKISGITRLIEEKVEDVDLSIFDQLEKNDILFIDSSHTVKPLGDVNFLFLRVIPQLKPGVVVHIHDIFFPVEYLPHHFFNKGTKMFWQEQYLLHAFLIFNSEYEILLSLSYLHFKYLDRIKNVFSWYQPERWPSSFWMRRISKNE